MLLTKTRIMRSMMVMEIKKRLSYYDQMLTDLILSIDFVVFLQLRKFM